MDIEINPEPFIRDELKWYHGGQAGLELDVKLSAGAGVDNLVLEANSDVDVDTYGVRLCELRVVEADTAGLPCAATGEGYDSMLATSDGQAFDNYGSIDVGPVCPATSGELKVRAVWEMPYDQDTDATPVGDADSSSKWTGALLYAAIINLLFKVPIAYLNTDKVYILLDMF